MKKLFAAVVLILATSTFAAADVYIKSNSHTDPISMGGQNQPASDTVTEQWIGNGQVAIITTGNTIILDLDKSMMFIVTHKAKTYIAAKLPLDFASLLPPQMADMLQSMKTSAKVSPTGNKKTIGTRSCDEYDVALTMMSMPMNLKVYASTDVPFDYNNYMEKVQSSLLKSQMMGIDEASIKELSKIKGFWIAQEMNGETMGVKIHQKSEVIEISSKPAPAGVYSVPSGYTKQDTLSMQDLQNRR